MVVDYEKRKEKSDLFGWIFGGKKIKSHSLLSYTVIGLRKS